MTWEMLAWAIRGVDAFFEETNTFRVTARVLDDEAGYVGDVVVGRWKVEI